MENFVDDKSILGEVTRLVFTPRVYKVFVIKHKGYSWYF